MRPCAVLVLLRSALGSNTVCCRRIALVHAAGARGCAAGASFRVKTYNAISPVGLKVYDGGQYDISPVRLGT